jgi:hypothetical protein
MPDIEPAPPSILREQQGRASRRARRLTSEFGSGMFRLRSEMICWRSETTIPLRLTSEKSCCGLRRR